MTITIHRRDSRWKGCTPLVRRAARAAMRGRAAGSLTILLTNDAEVRALNADYRGKDKPTNVLSFPDGDRGEDGSPHLGDIALAYETIATEARAQKKTFEAHLTHLVIHGTLHLLGYDHETTRDAAIMEALEIELLAGIGIKNPY